MIAARGERRLLSSLITTSFPSIAVRTHHHRCSFFTSPVPTISNSKTIFVFTTPNSNPSTPICHWSTSILTIVVAAEGKEKSEDAKVIAAIAQSIAVATTIAKPNFLQCTSTYFFRSIMETRKGNLGIKNGADLECMKAILLSILKFGSHIS